MTPNPILYSPTSLRMLCAVTLLSLVVVVASACGGDPPPADTEQWKVPHQQWPSCGYGPDALAYISASGDLRVRTLDGLTDDLVLGRADLVARADVEQGFVPDDLDLAPNRRWLAIQLHRPYPDNAYWVVALSCDGREIVKLGGPRVTSDFIIAPDSKTAAVWRLPDSESADLQGLFIVDTLSGNKRRLSESVAPAAWSADGKTLYAITTDRETGENILLSMPAAGGAVTKLHQESWITPCASRPLNGALYCGSPLTRYPLDGSPSEYLALDGNADVTADGQLFGLGPGGTLRALDLEAKTETDVWPGGGPKIYAFAF